MNRFEESRPGHEVHEIHRPQGHGLMDQKREKGGRSPAIAHVPTPSTGTVPGWDGSSYPGQPNGQYSTPNPTGSDPSMSGGYNAQG
jgi:hypothetical protein